MFDFSRYRPFWINVDDLEQEANFLELFVKAKDYEIFVNCNYWQEVKIEPDELLELLDNELIFKLLKNSLSSIEIILYLEKTLTQEEKNKIYCLRTKDIDIEISENKIKIWLDYLDRKLSKEEVLEVFNKLYEILYK
jgi:hypothetical protein